MMSKSETDIATFLICNSFLAGVLATVAVLQAGCSSTTATANRCEVATSTGESFTVNMVDGEPQEVITVSGYSVRFHNGEAIVGDHVLLATSSGKVESHRTPLAIMTKISRLPTIYLAEDTFEVTILDGDQGSNVTDATTGQTLLLAFTCNNPDCTGEPTDEYPFLFNSFGASRGLTSFADAEAPDSKQSFPALPCPACGRPEHVVQYQLPDSAARKAKLLDELARTRAARDRLTQPR